jgi:hypothetical protein
VALAELARAFTDHPPATEARGTDAFGDRARFVPLSTYPWQD